MGNLGEAFDKRLIQLGIKKQVGASMMVTKAQERIEMIFGERGRQNLRAISYQNGVLKVAASSNLWAAECQGRVSILLKEPITRVQFVVSKALVNKEY